MSKFTKKVFLAGYRGMVGNAIHKILLSDCNIKVYTADRASLDLRIQEKVRSRLKIVRVSCSATNGKHCQSSAELRKPGVINSRGSKIQIPGTNFSTTNGRNIHI